MVEELVSEDFSGSDVVAVAESAGQGEYLKVAEQGGLFQNAVDVNALGLSAG